VFVWEKTETKSTGMLKAKIIAKPNDVLEEPENQRTPTGKSNWL
jgi:hypothetical protein